LEAWIVPQPIEHWIESEQCGSERRDLSEKFWLLFRRLQGDDFLKARIEHRIEPEENCILLVGHRAAALTPATLAALPTARLPLARVHDAAGKPSFARKLL
jgi:hypothetical protein